MSDRMSQAEAAIDDAARLTRDILQRLQDDSFDNLEEMLEERGRCLSIFAQQMEAEKALSPAVSAKLENYRNLDTQLLEYLSQEKANVLAALSSLRSQQANPHVERHTDPVLVNHHA